MDYGRIPTIPEYYKNHINSSIDLLRSPWQCCFNHKENTPSFQYDVVKKKWSCFGRCHMHYKDVYDMHMLNYHLNSREEAKRSLHSLYKVPMKIEAVTKIKTTVAINEDKVEFEQVYQTCLRMATTPEKWIDMDLVMSKSFPTMLDLQLLLKKWDEEDNA